MNRPPSAPIPTDDEHDQLDPDSPPAARATSVPLSSSAEDGLGLIKPPTSLPVPSKVLPPPRFAPGQLSTALRTSTALSPASPAVVDAAVLHATAQAQRSNELKSALREWAEDVILKGDAPEEWKGNEDVWNRVARLERELAFSDFSKVKIKNTATEEFFQRSLRIRKTRFILKLEKTRTSALGLLIPRPNPAIFFPPLPVLQASTLPSSNAEVESDDDELNSDGEEVTRAARYATVVQDNQHVTPRPIARGDSGLVSPLPSKTGSPTSPSGISRPNSAPPIQSDLPLTLAAKSRIPPPPPLPLILPTLTNSNRGSVSASSSSLAWQEDSGKRPGLPGRPGGRVVAIPQRRPRLHRSPPTSASSSASTAMVVAGPSTSSSSLPVPATPSTPALFAPVIYGSSAAVKTVSTSRPLGPPPTLQASHQASPFDTHHSEKQDGLPTPSSPSLTRPRSLREHVALYSRYSKKVALPIEFGPSYLNWKREIPIQDATQKAWELAVEKGFWAYNDSDIDDARAVFHLLDVYGTVAIPREGDKEGGGKTGIGEFVVFPKETYVDMNPRFGSTPSSTSTDKVPPPHRERPRSADQNRQQQPRPTSASSRRSIAYFTTSPSVPPVSAPASLYAIDSNSIPGQQISRKRPSTPPPPQFPAARRRVSTDASQPSLPETRKFTIYEGPTHLVTTNGTPAPVVSTNGLVVQPRQRQMTTSGGGQFYPANISAGVRNSVESTSQAPLQRRPPIQPPRPSAQPQWQLQQQQPGVAVVHIPPPSMDPAEREERFKTFLSHVTALAKIQFRMLEEERIGGSKVLEAAWGIQERERQRAFAAMAQRGDEMELDDVQ